MKITLSILINFFAVSFIYAADNNVMRINMNGNIKNTHYLCVSHAGCVNLSAAIKGLKLPIQQGAVTRIVLVDSQTLRMYPQPLPASCHVNIAKNDTFLVSGNVNPSKNDHIAINQLHCSLKVKS